MTTFLPSLFDPRYGDKREKKKTRTRLMFRYDGQHSFALYVVLCIDACFIVYTAFIFQVLHEG